MAGILVALGANLSRDGTHPRETLVAALDALDAAPGIALAAASPFYRTPAVPAGSGPDFVNACAALDTALAPETVLDRLHAIEAALGRTRPERWAPRVCDLDLLAAGERVLPDARTLRAWMRADPSTARTCAPGTLVLPHPRMHERGFVLLPLADIAPGWRHPLLGLTVAGMRDALPREARAGIERLPP